MPQEIAEVASLRSLAAVYGLFATFAALALHGSPYRKASLHRGSWPGWVLRVELPEIVGRFLIGVL